MSTFNYTYNFGYIAEGIKKGKLLAIKYSDDASIMEHRLKVAVDDHQLLTRTASGHVSALFADLVDIAVSVHAADRLSYRYRDRTCRIQVQLPVRSSQFLDNLSIREELESILYWFTEDLWSFEFMPYVKSGRTIDVARRLLLDEKAQPTHVALWSGGLDALSGLYNRLIQEPNTHYTLFGTGSNEMIFSLQRDVAKKINTIFPHRTKLLQLPIRLRKEDTQISSSARSRGFIFLLLGAVCALQEKQHTLYIHENGIGALNLPLRDSEVGLDHSHSVHPLSLYRMGRWLSSLLEEPFSFENPFLFVTKAQICEELLQKNEELAFSTVSCDSRHRSDPMQCGYCSSCLLRRQAIAVLGKEDQTRYQITTSSERQKKSSKKERRIHLVAMLAQVETLRQLLSEENPWESMVKQYPLLDEIVQKMGGAKVENQARTSTHFLTLYRNYVSEWDINTVRHILKQGLLE